MQITLSQISDRITIERLVNGNFEYDDDPTAMMAYDALIDLWTNATEKVGDYYLTVDVARYGRDKTVMGYWDGLSLVKVKISEKQGTDMTEEDIKMWARDEHVPYSHIIIDEDGIGGGVVDHLPGVKGFVANSTPFTNKVTRQPENYQNLKAQCYYTLADYVNKHKMAIAYQDPIFRDQLIEELEQVKTLDADKDGKKKVLGKDEVKQNIGRSPDLSDMLMMRMWFEVATNLPRAAVQSLPVSTHTYGRRPLNMTHQVG